MTAMFPLQSVLLPGETLPLRIFEPRYVALVRDVMATPERTFGTVLIARGREVGGGDDRHDVGTLVRVIDCESQGPDRYAMRCLGVGRVRVRQWLPDDPYPRASTAEWPDEPSDPPADSVDTLQFRIEELIRRMAAARDVRLPRWRSLFRGLPKEPAQRLYALTSRPLFGEADRQAVLAAPSLAARVRVCHEALDTIDAVFEFSQSPRSE